MDTFPTDIIPSVGTSAVVKPRVLEAQFGDGYRQASQDGPASGARLRQWNISFQTISTATLKRITDFLDTQGGWKKFYWTQLPPYATEGAKVFICKEWQYTYNGGDITGIAATFWQQPPT